MPVTLSILDLVPITDDGDPARPGTAALQHSLELAQTADVAGYQRLWYAEHHNSPTFASSATDVLITRAASVTNRIRIGSGGVMLPNHSVLSVAETFGTLGAMFPGRIDLGLGRAPGTDRVTASLLRRGVNEDSLTAFEEGIRTLQWYFGDQSDPTQVPQTHGVRSRVASGTDVPIWVLGSSTGGASVAATLGLPFSFASHFAPFQIAEAVTTYRDRFVDTGHGEPRLMIGVNVMVAPNTAEAQYLWTSQQQMFLTVRRGAGGSIPAPVDDIATTRSSAEGQMVDAALQVNAIGAPEEVAARLRQLADATGADELILTTYTADPEARRRSFELLGRAWNATND